MTAQELLVRFFREGAFSTLESGIRSHCRKMVEVETFPFGQGIAFPSLCGFFEVLCSGISWTRIPSTTVVVQSHGRAPPRTMFLMSMDIVGQKLAQRFRDDFRIEGARVVKSR